MPHQRNMLSGQRCYGRKHVANTKASIASDAEIQAALAKGRSEVDDTPVAESVEYYPKLDVYVVSLKNKHA